VRAGAHHDFFRERGLFFKVAGGCPTFRAWRPNGSKKAPPLTGRLREAHTSAIGSYVPSDRGPKGFCKTGDRR